MDDPNLNDEGKCKLVKQLSNCFKAEVHDLTCTKSEIVDFVKGMINVSQHNDKNIQDFAVTFFYFLRFFLTTARSQFLAFKTSLITLWVTQWVLMTLRITPGVLMTLRVTPMVLDLP